MEIIMALVSLVSAIIGALIGGQMSRSASLEATERSHKKNLELQEKERKLLINTVLQAIYSEIKCLWEIYMLTIGNELENLNENQPFLFYYVVSQEYFTVYNGNSSLIGSIDDHDLRDTIITTYGMAKALIDSYSLNNELLKNYNWYSGLTKIMPVTQHYQPMQIYESLMKDYAIKIKYIHGEVKDNKDKLINMMKENKII